MSEVPSVINIGEFAKPVTVLIEKISEAVGFLLKPYQIKRVAKAESEAEIIKAETQIEITDLQRRALNRFVTEEAKKQANIESITQMAIPQLTDSSTPQNMENDWITNFFDKCRIVSDIEMQSLWAKVLAGEANTPGTYSKRTVNFLGSLDKADAQLFTILCGFVWSFGGNVNPLIYDFNASIYKDKGITFSALTHLDDIGLISFSDVTGLSRENLSKSIFCDYYEIKLRMEFKNQENNVLSIGHVIFTKTGEQLARICDLKPIDGFQDYVIKRWTQEGLIISIVPFTSMNIEKFSNGSAYKDISVKNPPSLDGRGSTGD